MYCLCNDDSRIITLFCIPHVIVTNIHMKKHKKKKSIHVTSVESTDGMYKYTHIIVFNTSSIVMLTCAECSSLLYCFY